MLNQIFSGKICIITGAASGIGRSLSVQLGSAGACVVLADIDVARANEAAAEIVRAGGKARAIRVDVTDAQAVRELVEGTAAELGRIDYLFNNAGTAVIGEIRDLSLEQWRRVIEVNLFGEIHGIHYTYPIMIRQGFGHIVNTASGFGLAPGPLNTPYVASKFAIVGMSHALAAEARGFGIDVSIVCPGYVQTPMVSDLQAVNVETKDMVAQIPVKLVPTETAAQIILAGVARKQMLIAFPRYVSVLTFLHRFLPGLFARIGLRRVETFRKLRKAPHGEQS